MTKLSESYDAYKKRAATAPAPTRMMEAASLLPAPVYAAGGGEVGEVPLLTETGGGT